MQDCPDNNLSNDIQIVLIIILIMLCSSFYFSICDYEIITLSAYTIAHVATCALHAETYKYLLCQEQLRQVQQTGTAGTAVMLL